MKREKETNSTCFMIFHHWLQQTVELLFACFHLLMEGYFLAIVSRMLIQQISNRSEKPIIKQTSDNSGETSMQEPWWERAGSMLTRILGGKLAMHIILGICKSAD